MLIELDNPLNKDTDLTGGLVAWWEALPGVQSGYRWVDLVSGISGLLNGSAPTNGFRGTTRPSGWGEWTGDGSTGYADCGKPAIINLSGIMSFSAWINLGTTVGLMGIAGAIDAGFANYQWSLQANRTSGKLEADWTSAVILTSTTVLTANTWHHVGFTRYGSSGSWTCEIWIDGQMDSSTTTATNPGSQGEFCIGRAGLNGNMFNGRLNSIMIFNKRLLKQEWGELYQQSLKGFPALLNQSRRIFGVSTLLFRREWSARAGSRPSKMPNASL